MSEALTVWSPQSPSEAEYAQSTVANLTDPVVTTTNITDPVTSTTVITDTGLNSTDISATVWSFDPGT